MKVTRGQAAAQARIAKALAEVGFALPGSLTVKAYKCGKPNCRCRADPPQLHGPYPLWTRKRDNKTVTRTLTDDELADYQPLFDNAKKLRALIAELQELSLELVDQQRPTARTRRSTRKTPSADDKPSTKSPAGGRRQPQTG